jgi:LPPG:FO 2-phospho-L-lactate transferase
MLTVLAGGVGAARFLRGLAHLFDREPSRRVDVTVIVNVGDDLDRFGLRVCPDLDTITYTLGGVIHREQEWGRSEESFTVAKELERLGEDGWFTLGDRDLALHLHRTHRLAQGEPLHKITADVAAAWNLPFALLPATNERVATHIHTVDRRDLPFQDWWIRERAEPEVARVELTGRSSARPAPGVLQAIASCDRLIVCPSNPVVSIGTILEIPGIAGAVADAAAPTVGVSPIIGGSVVRGMADRLLPAIGVEVSAMGVAQHYAPWLDGWVIDQVDASSADDIRDLGLAVAVTNTMMDDPEIAADLAATVLDLPCA